MQLDFGDEPTKEVIVEGDADTSKRVNAADKRIINSKTDVNQLVPFKYKWAWDMYLKACENQWMPQECIMEQDVALWNSGKLTQEERDVVIRNLSRLVAGGINVAGSLTLSIYRFITAPEVRQYLLRQGFEEAIRPHVYQHVADALQLQNETIQYSRSAVDKEQFLTEHLGILKDPLFKTGTPETDAKFLQALIVYSSILKGIFSVVSFTQVLNLGRQGKMVKTAEQYGYMLRDEMMHFNAGVDMVNAIRMENPHLWSAKLTADMKLAMCHAVDLEYSAAKEVMDMAESKAFLPYLQCIANQRATQMGLGVIYPNVKNPFPEFAESFGMKKEAGVVSAQASQAKTGGALEW